MSDLLDGKVCFVTGGSNGLGREIINVFSGNGAVGTAADVVPVSNETPLPTGFDYVPTDVTDEQSLQASISDTVRRFGRLDVVVANAGIVPSWSATEDLDLPTWSKVLAVNVQGIAATLKHATPVLKKHGGSIVVTASITSYRGAAFQMLYTASKHAALGIIRAGAFELGRHQIRVNGIAPGPIATDALLDRIRSRADQGGMSQDEALALHAKETSLNRMVTATEVGKAALFLACDLSSGITGILIPVDAGIP
jgi:NAD(P)-dependent dehydrogenase (short-subunit alcohol dehydrogenase family)